MAGSFFIGKFVAQIVLDMLQPATLKFLKNLQKNNNKAWFEKNRTAYEDAKSDFLSLVEKLIPGIASFDPAIADQLAKNCTFRINRDVRFSQNKSPYKNNLAAYFNQAGKKGNGAGYYLHIEPGKSFAAAGIWQPEPADLAKIRQEIDYNLDDWKKILSSSGFKKNFAKGLDLTNKLARPPKGYSDDNPAIEYVKLKSFVIRSPLSDDDVTDKNLLKKIVKLLEAANPVVRFLNKAID
ncbi:MAG: DUF2461 domain-containing protein [Ferruginibacter sp.]